MNTFDPAIIKKSFEVSYALIRIADTIHPDPFASHFKRFGLESLSATASGNGKRALAALRAVEYLVRLAGSTGVISSRNAEVIAEETNLLVTHINSAMDAPSAGDFDISAVFSSADVPYQGHGEEVVSSIDSDMAPENLVPAEYPSVDVPPSAPVELRKGGDAHTEISARARIRQSAILDRIRQSGNCRMNELRQSFSDVSERTLRYDLEQLVAAGLVERIGQSGPATSYRARQISTA
jgi:hypothetical protein